MGSIHWLLVIVVILHVALVSGHGKMLVPVPRAGSGGRSDTGTKLTPYPPNDAANTCGGAANSDPGPLALVATYQAGSSINIVWRTTILHASSPGVRIAVQYNSSDLFSNNVLADGLDIGSSDGTGCHNATVTLPAGRTGSNAIIQWMWATSADGGYYMGCADVSIISTPVSDTNDYSLYNAQCLGIVVASTTTTTTSTSGEGGESGGTSNTNYGTTDSSSNAYKTVYGSFFAVVMLALLF